MFTPERISGNDVEGFPDVRSPGGEVAGSAKIVLSYRRTDAQMVTGRVCDRLSQHFGDGNVFMDIDSVPVGVDFHDHLDLTLSQADILIAVIGPRWVGPRRGGPPRISDEEDFVRLEIELALQRNLAVVPLLVEGASLPPRAKLPPSLHPLLRRQAFELDSGADFHTHLTKLIGSIDRLLAARPADTTPPPSSEDPAPVRSAAEKPAHEDSNAGSAEGAAPEGIGQPPSEVGTPPKHGLRTAMISVAVIGVLGIALLALFQPQTEALDQAGLQPYAETSWTGTYGTADGSGSLRISSPIYDAASGMGYYSVSIANCSNFEGSGPVANGYLRATTNDYSCAVELRSNGDGSLTVNEDALFDCASLHGNSCSFAGGFNFSSAYSDLQPPEFVDTAAADASAVEAADAIETTAEAAADAAAAAADEAAYADDPGM